MSASAFVAGVLFALLGAWLAAALTFAAGLVLALVAAHLLRRDPTPSRNGRRPDNQDRRR